MEKMLKLKMQQGQTDLKLQNDYKKHRNYCNKLIKNAVRVSRGQNITSSNNIKEVWSSINDILRPERLSRSNLKIETEGQVIEEQSELAETFNIFFKEKIEKLAAGIKKDQNIDPLSKLKNKLQNLDLNQL